MCEDDPLVLAREGVRRQAWVRRRLAGWGPLILPSPWRMLLLGTPGWVQRGPEPDEVVLACVHEGAVHAHALVDPRTGARARVFRHRPGLRGGVVRTKVLVVGWVMLCGACHVRCRSAAAAIQLGRVEVRIPPRRPLGRSDRRRRR